MQAWKRKPAWLSQCDRVLTLYIHCMQFKWRIFNSLIRHHISICSGTARSTQCIVFLFMNASPFNSFIQINTKDFSGGDSRVPTVTTARRGRKSVLNTAKRAYVCACVLQIMRCIFFSFSFVFGIFMFANIRHYASLFRTFPFLNGKMRSGGMGMFFFK